MPFGPAHRAALVFASEWAAILGLGLQIRNRSLSFRESHVGVGNGCGGAGPEKAGERRRRFYRLTAAGRAVLADRRRVWADFIDALQQVARLGHA